MAKKEKMKKLIIRIFKHNFFYFKYMKQRRFMDITIKQMLIAFILCLLLLGTTFAAYTNSEAFSRMQQLAKEGKVPLHVIEQGKYKYVEGTRAARVTGKNVFMRSQPSRTARIITKLNDVELNYLGEWTHPKNGERWVCVRKYASIDVGWVYGKYIELLKEIDTNPIKQTTTNKKPARARSNKQSTLDDCVGAFLGFLLISPLVSFFNKKSDEIERAKKAENARLTRIRSTQCPNYRSLSCNNCKYLSRRAFSNKSYSKCDYYEAYVNVAYSPEFNANNLIFINEAHECCPYYFKSECKYCPLINFSDKLYKSFWCEYFKDYVEPNCTPQYNSIGHR